jgi:hypothetical protein
MNGTRPGRSGSLGLRGRSSVQFSCPACNELFLWYVEDVEPAKSLRCPSCGTDYKIAVEVPRQGKPLETCWICGTREFYLLKDFNRVLGFLFAGISAFVVLLLILVDPVPGLVCLVLVVVIEALVYRSLAVSAACYRCRGIYRGIPVASPDPTFFFARDLDFAEARDTWRKSFASPEPKARPEPPAGGLPGAKAPAGDSIHDALRDSMDDSLGASLRESLRDSLDDSRHRPHNPRTGAPP